MTTPTQCCWLELPHTRRWHRWGQLVSILALLLLPVLSCPNMQAAEAQAEDNPTMRTWTDVEGRTIEARAIRLEGETLVLERGGREFRVPAARLSPDDRRWLNQNQLHVPRTIIRPGEVKAADEATVGRMIRIPGEPLREWEVEPGRKIHGRLLGVDDRMAVIQRTGSDAVVMFDRLRLRGDDFLYMQRV